MKKHKWEKCNTCQHLVDMVSHPSTDGKPLDNVIGHACIIFYVLEKGPIIPNWDKNSIQCEMHSPKSN